MTPALLAKLPADWTVPKPEKNWYREPRLHPSFAACKAVTRQHATSFFFASFPLPQEKKWAAFAIYAFCRWVDDVIDEAPDPAAIDPKDLNKQLTEIYAGNSQLPFAPALCAVNHQYAIPQTFYADLIQGCCMDRQPMKIQTYEELEVYCYYVASIVGLMMSKVFGLQSVAGVHQAVEMGIAMQLTNILRDIAEDYKKDRVYIPLEELALFQLDETVIHQQNSKHPNWQKFMRFQIDRARTYYAKASSGLSLLANDGSRLTAHLMSTTYAGILNEIERQNYDIFSSRVYVPTRRKVLRACKAISGIRMF